MSHDLTFAALAPDYDRLFASMVVRPSARAAIDEMARAVLAAKARCQVGERLTGTHWVRIALQQLREAGTDSKGRIRFDCHPHNGDPLTRRTTHDPAGRPGKGSPPFSWEQSWVDAYHEGHLEGIRDWSIAMMAFTLEEVNGWGYRQHGVSNPYLWAGTLHYVRGKYIKDHVFDANFADRQTGTMPVLARLMQLDPSIRFGALIDTGAPRLVDTTASRPAAAKTAAIGATAVVAATGALSLGVVDGRTAVLALAPAAAALVHAAYDLVRHHFHLTSLIRG